MSDIDAGTIGSTAPGHYGVEASEVTLAETTIAAAWNVQGDGERAPFLSEVQRLFEVALPLVPNTTTHGVAWTALWLGPKSWLLVARVDSTSQPRLAAFTTHRDALNDVGGALFDLSASRVGFVVRGKHAATVLAKGCPLDFHLRAFPAGQCAQSLLGHVNALIYRPHAAPVFTVMVARSFARDVWRALCLSAAQYGYDVAQPTAYR
jgi:sarcosine oxidase subunit gamma